MTQLGTVVARSLRAPAVAVGALAIALSAVPAEAATKHATQVRKWSASGVSAQPNTTVKFTVKITSRGRASAKRTVVLQRYAGGTWRTATKVRSSKYGNAVLRLSVGAAGTTQRVRVRVAATSTRKGAVTSTRKVVVRAPAAASATDRRILTLVNQARASARTCGSKTYPAQPPLAWNARLDAAAQGHATDMATADYFSHTGRDGSTVADRVTRRGYLWRAVGENIAAGQRTADEAMEGWLKSAGHCRNIMSASFTELGTGTATNTASYYGVYWVQNFGAPR